MTSDETPTAWVVQDTRCGHEFGAARDRRHLDVILEVAVGVLPEGSLSVHPVRLEPPAVTNKSTDCKCCLDRQRALLIGVFRPALASAARSMDANPIEVSDAYDGLLMLGHTPHRASRMVTAAIVRGAYRTPIVVPDSDDPRWSA